MKHRKTIQAKLDEFIIEQKELTKEIESASKEDIGGNRENFDSDEQALISSIKMLKWVLNKN